MELPLFIIVITGKKKKIFFIATKLFKLFFTNLKDFPNIFIFYFLYLFFEMDLLNKDVVSINFWKGIESESIKTSFLSHRQWDPKH